MRHSTALASVLAFFLLAFFLISPIQAQTACTLVQASQAIEAGDYHEAVTIADCVIESNPTSGLAYLRRAQANLLDGDWFAAHSDYITSERYWRYGEYSSQANYDYANHYILEHPDDAAGWVLRAHQEWYWAQDADRIDSCTTALEIDPANLYALVCIGSSHMYMNVGTWEEELEAAVEAAPHNAVVLATVGDTYDRAGRHDIAQLYAFRAIATNPRLAAAYALRGQTNIGLNRPAIAVRDFLQALDLGLPRALEQDTLIQLGELYLRQGEAEEAARTFERAAAVYPADFDAAQRIGYVYDEMGDTVKTAHWFHQFIVWAEERTVVGDPLTIGDPVEVMIEPRTVFQFPVQLEAGEIDVFEINPMTSSLRIDPLAVLLGPDGTPLAGNDDEILNQALNARIEDFVVPEDGEYTLLVTSTNFGVPGPVQVVVERTLR